MTKSIDIPSPCYILKERVLVENLERITDIADQSGAEIILALKGFAMWSAFPIIKKHIKGATASSLHELKLCNEFMGCKSHTYIVAYKEDEIDEIIAGSSHISFNSLNQFHQFKNRTLAAGVSIGLRVNPEYSDVETELYNPASPTSRLGITFDQFENGLPSEVEGIHYHVHCESDSYALEKSLQTIVDGMGQNLLNLKWINVGGGHLMTKEDYNSDHLISTLKSFKDKYNIHIIIEPGSAFAWQSGTLHTTVLDIIEQKEVKTAIIDASFTCHMPDCLEMPYRPKINNGFTDPSKGNFKYRLGGMSCLAGDFLEEYSFDMPLKIGDHIEFLDMMHYTMVKSNTFNGIQHPAIGIENNNGKFSLIRSFNYEDYKNRLS